MTADQYAVTRAIKHFRRRALERHGLMLSDSDISRTIAQITSGCSEFLRWSDGPGFRCFYRVRIFGDPYIVLYDFEVDVLVTIFHNSWFKLENGEWVERIRRNKKRRRWKKWEYKKGR